MLFRPVALGTVIAATVLLSACSSTVAGTAIRAQGPGGDQQGIPRLDEAMLDDVPLSIGELNDIVGSTRMEITSELEEMTDHSSSVSDPDCLGAIYGAEEPVYEGSGWIAVRDQVAREPDDDNDHWVEQTAVLYPRSTDAEDFFEDSSAIWQYCGDDEIAVADGDYVWTLDDVEVGDTMIVQNASQDDTDGWACQHALSWVSNVTVEVWACGYSIFDDAVQIANVMIENAAGQ